MTPSIYIVSANASGDIDPTLMQNLLCHLPNRVTSAVHADVVMVCVSHQENYRFNTELKSITKPIVLVDMMEYYPPPPRGQTHLFGDDLPLGLLENQEWTTFSKWIREKGIALYFKRELFERDRQEFVVPIEWPCVLPAWEIQTKDQFDLRPFEVFFNWGYSNPIRPRLHGEIFGLMGDQIVDVISSFDHIDAKQNEPQRKWISIHSPHTHRTHINEIARRQSQSKMSISLPGSGIRCFRDLESPAHTVPVYLDTGIAYSHPWKDEVNCLFLYESVPPNLASQLSDFCHRDDLHSLYVAAQENLDRYRSTRYVNEYIIPNIERALS